MKKIPLTQGKYAIVDDKDFKFLSQWNWHLRKTLNKERFYAVRMSPRVKGKQTVIKMHSLIIGTPKGMDTDHINGDGLDNRKSNLRICTRSENCLNRRRHSNNKSGYKGVFWHKQSKKWEVSIQINKKQITIGRFENIKEAIKVCKNARIKYHKEFANTG